MGSRGFDTFATARRECEKTVTSKPSIVGPNTFLIGAPKCGTTAVATFLNERQDVFMGYPKEPSFWSTDLVGTGATLRIRGLDDYLKIYEQAGHCPVVLDASTSYIYSQVAVANILEFCPEAKFILMLRNQVDLAHAYHMEKIFNCIENVEDFEAAWRLQDERKAGTKLPPRCPEPKELQYRDVAAIGGQLSRVKAKVAPEKLLVLFHEDLVKTPVQLWTDLLEFLELPPDGREHFPVVAPAHYNRSMRLARLYQNPPQLLAPMVRWVKGTLTKSLSAAALQRVKSLLLSPARKRTPLRPAFRVELTKYFEADMQLLEELTGRDLTHWRQSEI